MILCRICKTDFKGKFSNKYRKHPDLCVKCTFTGLKKGSLNNHDLYGLWNSIYRRCHSKDSVRAYTDKQISMSDRWRPDKNPRGVGFKNFLNDMGGRPSSEYSIDRVNNDHGYTPENCRWANRQTQARNKIRTKKHTYMGLSMTLVEWSEYTGISYGLLNSRMQRKFPLDKVFSKNNLHNEKKRKDALKLVYNGEEKTVMEWSNIIGICPVTLRDRIYRGWTAEECLDKKLRNKSKNIYFHKKRKTWRVLVQVNCVVRRLGEFKTKEEAVSALNDYRRWAEKFDLPTDPQQSSESSSPTSPNCLSIIRPFAY